MTDLIDESIRVFGKYNTPDSVDSQYKHYPFWRACLAAGLLEVEIAYQEGDMEQVTNELVDLFSIAIDSMYKSRELGVSPQQVKARIAARLARNDKKEMSGRDMKFYQDKSHGLAGFVESLGESIVHQQAVRISSKELTR